MTTEQFRQKLIFHIDGLLAHTWAVVGEQRWLLEGVRSYLLSASADIIEDILEHLPKGDRP